MSSHGTIERIDNALRILYNNIGCKNYDTNGIGKFMQYCQNNEFGDNDIYEELHGNPQDCVICDFDPTFPLNHALQNDDKQKNISIFQILKNCCDYGRAEKVVQFKVIDYAPTFSNLKTINIDINSEEISKLKELYKDQIPNIIMNENNNNYLQLLNISNLNDKIPLTIYLYELFVRCILDKENNINYNDCIETQFSIIWDKYPLIRALFSDLLDYKARDMVCTNIKTFTQALFPLIISHKNINTLINDNMNEIVDNIGVICDCIGKNTQSQIFNTPFQIDFWIIPANMVTNNDIDQDQKDQKDDDHKNISLFNIDQSLKELNIQYEIFNSMSDVKETISDIKPYERIGIVLDRRNKENKMYVYKPVTKFSKIPMYFIPETLFEFSKNDIFGSHFGVSFQCYAKREIRSYFMYKNGCIPFRVEDIIKLWPKYFVLSNENKLYLNDKQKHNEMVQRFKCIRDDRFNSFYNFITNKSSYNEILYETDEIKENGVAANIDHRIGHIKKAMIGYNEWINQESHATDHETLLQFLQHLLGDNYSMIDLLNDYHFILNLCLHNNDIKMLTNIYKNITNSTPCVVNKCTIMVRNNRNKSMCTLQEKMKLFLDIKNENDILLMQLLDTIHCTLYHIFDIGYKLSFDEANIIENKLKDKVDDITYESLYYNEMKQIIGSKQNKLKKEIMQNTQNKFMTNIIMPDDDKEQDNDNENIEPVALDIGTKFVYWNMYKNDSNYVKSKYKNIKEELLNAPNHKLRNEEWVEEHKRCEFLYIKSKMYRKLKCKYNYKYKYEINKNDAIDCDHLTALKCFCDYLQLKHMFLKSFKRLNENDTIDDIKKRHSYFVNWARLIAEVIQCFGEGLSTRNDIKFHHIINKNMYFQFNRGAVFSCLTAVTSQLEVILSNYNNSNKKGSVLSLEYNCCAVQYFNCCYISSFSNELECILWNDKNNIMSINNIINANECYKHYIRAINIFYNLINGKDCYSYTENDTLNKFDILCIDQMIFSLHKIPQYIQLLFKYVCKNIKIIIINKGLLDKQYKKIKKYFITEKTEDWVRIEILNKLFINMEQIIIRPKINAERERDFSINLTKSTMFSMMSAFQALPKKSKLNIIKIIKPKEKKIKLKDVPMKQSNMFKFMGWNIKYFDNEKDKSILYPTLEISKIIT